MKKSMLLTAGAAVTLLAGLVSLPVRQAHSQENQVDVLATKTSLPLTSFKPLVHPSPQFRVQWPNIESLSGSQTMAMVSRRKAVVVRSTGTVRTTIWTQPLEETHSQTFWSFVALSSRRRTEPVSFRQRRQVSLVSSTI